MKKNIQIGLWIGGLLGLDWISKYVFYNLSRGKDQAFLEPVFNEGISRGLPVNKRIVLLISLIGIGFFVLLWRKKHISQEVFILLLAGTLGNFVDRIILGGVRDFIALGDFPVFNLADCYLNFAVLFLIKNEIFPCNSKTKP